MAIDRVDDEYLLSDEFKRDTIAYLTARAEKDKRLIERRRRRLRILSFGLLGR